VPQNCGLAARSPSLPEATTIDTPAARSQRAMGELSALAAGLVLGSRLVFTDAAALRQCRSGWMTRYRKLSGSELTRGTRIRFMRRVLVLVHVFDPLSAPCGGHEWICKVLRFPCNLIAPELHDAHGIGRLAVICQDEFGDPKISAANNSPYSKALFARLSSALVLYVASTAGSLA
jgi:hypothetical protein